MANWVDEIEQKYFKVPLSVIDEKVKKLCKEYGIISDPTTIRRGGMSELFDENGNLLEDYAREKLEYGKKAGMFGNIVSEGTWAGHLGD